MARDWNQCFLFVDSVCVMIFSYFFVFSQWGIVNIEVTAPYAENPKLSKTFSFKPGIKQNSFGFLLPGVLTFWLFFPLYFLWFVRNLIRKKKRKRFLFLFLFFYFACQVNTCVYNFTTDSVCTYFVFVSSFLCVCL